MITPKLNEDELGLVEILRHPVWCSEFLRNVDIPKGEDPWILTDYQIEMLCDHNKYVCLACGRAVGKSEMLLDKNSWYLVNNFFSHDPVSIITPNRVHLEPLFSKLRRWLQTHSFLSQYVTRHSINSAVFNIRAKNNYQLDCRIAGTSGTGANVIGLHTPVIMLDEGGYFPWGTFKELLPTHNTWQRGAQMFISGVPTGQRENNVLYFADVVDPNFTHFNIPQQRNPRYAPADEVRNRKQFGGTESEDYIHLVLGRHGAPVYALFDRAKMLISSYDVFVSKIYGIKLKANPTLLVDVLRLLPLKPRGARVAIGIDLGYSEPTVISILRRGDNTPWRFMARLVLTQVPYPQQERFIAQLDLRYNPVFIGIDAGGPGKVVIQHLVNEKKYDHIYTKVWSADFSANIEVGYDQDGNVLKEKAKVYATQRLQQLTNTHQIMYSSADDDVITELERTTYTRSPSGNIIYKTMGLRGGKHGDDHNVASLLAFVLASHYKYDSKLLRRRRGTLWASKFM